MNPRERKPERYPNLYPTPFPADLRPRRKDLTYPESHPVRERPTRTTRTTQPQPYPQRSTLQGRGRTDREDWARGQRRPSFGYGKGVLERATPFFFTNFPEDWEMGDMWRVFIKFGRVIQVFIAKKRDRKGRRFGFVRFLDLKDTKAVEYQLNQIQFGQQTLQANLARFSMDDAHKRREENKAHEDLHQRNIGVKEVQKDRSQSYADVVKSKQGGTERMTRPHWEWKSSKQEGAKKTEGEQWYGIEVKAEDEDIRRLENSFVGQSKCPEIISTLQDKFAMEGYFSAKITPMGGNLVLISSEDEEELKYLVREGRDWLSQWFTDIRPWTPEEVAAERFTWLRCQGVPLHIWKSNFFETVACMFGKFVSLDGSTIKKSRLDVAKVLILTPLQENINKTLKIKVKNRFFQVRISEEVGVDNIFTLQSDFNLCRNDDSTSESWSEGSNWGVVEEEESWDDWEVAIEKAGTEKNNSVEPSRPAEHTPEEEKFEKVSETAMDN
ncbi:hypothetical protein SLEP1_g3943 [Rubroshorea leprosula]|uniref:RRM domain-containing protein n=1 Tax=Rubroshorea leprosula TaxID=152421 RepID=A0AAV5HUP4_9ROSI|nr:hypothetical protein SLEP1_g3943 [Rubroshorea leprosula]